MRILQRIDTCFQLTRFNDFAISAAKVHPLQKPTITLPKN